jgi:hypothetical protein
MTRGNVLLVSIMCLVALAGLVGAISAMAGVFSAARPAAPATAVAMMNLPTIRPIWDPSKDQPAPEQLRSSPTAGPLEILGTEKPEERAPTPSATPVLLSPTETATLEPSPTQTPPLEPSPAPTLTTSPTVSPTVSLTITLTVSAGVTVTPFPRPTSTQTAAPLAAGRISGRIFVDSTPVAAGLKLRLEDQAYTSITETVVAEGGVYAFNHLTDSSEGYNVVVSQNWNPQLNIETVASWAWLGPMPVVSGGAVQAPDMEISLRGFKPKSPPLSASISAALLSSSSPITFTWSSYPQADAYWIDLTREATQDPIWQSAMFEGTAVSWDGTLSDGSHVQTGDYWWGIGTRRWVPPCTLTVYSYLTKLKIGP